MILKLTKSSDNTKNVLINIINGMGIKGIGIIIGLLTTPAYMRYFNDKSVLGVWFTALSILSWILNFDMGIGNGLRNKLVGTFVAGDDISSRKYISSAYLFLSVISIGIGIILSIIIFFVPWNRLFNIDELVISPDLLFRAVLIMMLSILIQFVLRIITSILYALQNAFIPNLLGLCSNIIMLIYVGMCNRTGINNSVTNLAFSYMLATNIPLLIATITLFLTKLRNMVPSFKFYSREHAKDTLKIGGIFLALQIVSMIINNSTVFLISLLKGSFYVVEYNVYFKVFSLASIMFSIITTPIWSAITKAKEEKNYKWIKKVVRTLQAVAIFFVFFELILIPFMQLIFDLWLKEQSFKVDTIIMIIFAIEQGVMIWSGINAAICSGLNELKFQFILITCGALIMYPLSFLFNLTFDQYYVVTIAHIISLLPYCIGQTLWLEKKLQKSF